MPRRPRRRRVDAPQDDRSVTFETYAAAERYALDKSGGGRAWGVAEFPWGSDPNGRAWVAAPMPAIRRMVDNPEYEYELVYEGPVWWSGSDGHTRTRGRTASRAARRAGRR